MFHASRGRDCMAKARLRVHDGELTPPPLQYRRTGGPSVDSAFLTMTRPPRVVHGLSLICVGSRAPSKGESSSDRSMPS